MTTYNFNFNNALNSYLNSRGLYFRTENDAVFFPAEKEMDNILGLIKNAKEACAIPLMWGWVETTTIFWTPVKDKSSLIDVLHRVASLYTEGKNFFSPPPKNDDVSKGIDMLWEMAKEEPFQGKPSLQIGDPCPKCEMPLVPAPVLGAITRCQRCNPINDYDKEDVELWETFSEGTGLINRLNDDLNDYLDEQDLYISAPTISIFNHMVRENMIRTPYEACALALAWGYVDSPSEFWGKGLEPESFSNLLKKLHNFVS